MVKRLYNLLLCENSIANRAMRTFRKSGFGARCLFAGIGNNGVRKFFERSCLYISTNGANFLFFTLGGAGCGFHGFPFAVAVAEGRDFFLSCNYQSARGTVHSLSITRLRASRFGCGVNHIRVILFRLHRSENISADGTGFLQNSVFSAGCFSLGFP